MRLLNLDAHFLGEYGPEGYRKVDTLAEAQGVMFQCPKCSDGKERGDGFMVGVHYVICWFRDKVPATATPGPGRWNPSGVGLDDLTFVGPGATSVLLTSGCGWHGFVQNGDAT